MHESQFPPMFARHLNAIVGAGLEADLTPLKTFDVSAGVQEFMATQAHRILPDRLYGPCAPAWPLAWLEYAHKLPDQQSGPDIAHLGVMLLTLSIVPAAETPEAIQSALLTTFGAEPHVPSWSRVRRRRIAWQLRQYGGAVAGTVWMGWAELPDQSLVPMPGALVTFYDRDGCLLSAPGGWLASSPVEDETGLFRRFTDPFFFCLARLRRLGEEAFS